MKYERIYEFLEEFLKWNFRRLPEHMEEQLYGSPSFALHMWLNLSKMRVSSTVSMVLFDSSYHLHHRETLEMFLRGGKSNLHNTPVHFVTSINDNGFDVHFDLKGDITGGSSRIRSIHGLREMKLDRLISKNRVPKSLHGNEIYALKTVMNRMERFYSSWVLGTKKEHWKEFESYHRILSSLERKKPRSSKHMKPVLKSKI